MSHANRLYPFPLSVLSPVHPELRPEPSCTQVGGAERRLPAAPRSHPTETVRSRAGPDSASMLKSGHGDDTAGYSAPEFVDSGAFGGASAALPDLLLCMGHLIGTRASAMDGFDAGLGQACRHSSQLLSAEIAHRTRSQEGEQKRTMHACKCRPAVGRCFAEHSLYEA